VADGIPGPDRDLLEPVAKADAELRIAIDRLEVARLAGLPLHELRVLHLAVDRAFDRAARATDPVVKAVREAHAVGASRRVHRDPQVRYWEDYANTIRTMRERHRMEESDDHGVLLSAAVRVGTRAANPMQAGTEFEPEDLVAERLRQPRIGVALGDVVDHAGDPTPHRALATGRVVDSDPASAVD
jgi:hypothetical protein